MSILSASAKHIYIDPGSLSEAAITISITKWIGKGAFVQCFITVQLPSFLWWILVKGHIAYSFRRFLSRVCLGTCGLRGTQTTQEMVTSNDANWCTLKETEKIWLRILLHTAINYTTNGIMLTLPQTSIHQTISIQKRLRFVTSRHPLTPHSCFACAKLPPSVLHCLPPSPEYDPRTPSTVLQRRHWTHRWFWPLAWVEDWQWARKFLNDEMMIIASEQWNFDRKNLVPSVNHTLNLFEYRKDISVGFFRMYNASNPGQWFRGSYRHCRARP